MESVHATAATPRKCNVATANAPAALPEETVAHPSPRSVPAIGAAAQSLRQSRESRRKRDFKFLAWALTIVGCGLLALAAGTLVMRRELAHQRQRLAAEYEEKTSALVAEYEGMFAQLKRREEQLVSEYDRKLADAAELKTRMASLKKREAQLKKRELSGLGKDGREARQRLKEKCARLKENGVGLILKEPLIGEPLVDEPDAFAFDKFEYYVDNRRVSQAEVETYFQLSYSAKYDRGVLTRREAIPVAGDDSADPGQSTGIFASARSLNALSPDDLHETERMGSNWRDKVNWRSSREDFGITSRPDRFELDRYQYFVDGHPITPAEVKQYLALSWYKRMAVCALSRRQLLTARRAEGERK